MRTVAIVQARMGSTRLPGKVLRTLVDRPMLAWVCERLMRARLLDSIVVASSTLPADDPIEGLCHERGWSIFRGSESDVLGRYVGAVAAVRAESVVRVTSDCPLIDPHVVDLVIASYQASSPPCDYASNTLERSYPRGLDVEVFSRVALERADAEDSNPGSREHVTPWIYRHPESFRLRNVENAVDLSRHRWTVDTVEDFEFVSRILGVFGGSEFSWGNVLELLDRNPDWCAVNASIHQRSVPTVS